MNEHDWLQCVIDVRGSLTICRRRVRAPRGRNFVYETRFVVSDTVRYRLDKIKRLLRGGQVTKHDSPANKKGYQWLYFGNTKQVRRLFELVSFENTRHQVVAPVVEVFLNTYGANNISDADYETRERCYQEAKIIHKKSWCE